MTKSTSEMSITGMMLISVIASASVWLWRSLSRLYLGIRLLFGLNLNQGDGIGPAGFDGFQGFNDVAVKDIRAGRQENFFILPPGQFLLHEFDEFLYFREKMVSDHDAGGAEKIGRAS